MKLKYFIPLFALVALLSSCSDDDATYLDEIRVSQSYVSLDVEGGSATITIDAQQDWAFDRIFRQITKNDDGTNDTTFSETPAWLKVSQVSGSAGQSKITFSADATPDGRSTELRIKCAGKTQVINVIQGVSSVSEASVKEVLDGPEGKTYRVTGKVTSIANTEYGNWYLTDDTGTLYIYGTLDKGGNAGKNNSIAAWGIEVGDIITVEGPKAIYGSTIELKDVTVINLQKSLIRVESTDPENRTLPLEGGEITMNLSCKGNGVSVDIPEDAKNWLSIVSVSAGDNPVVKFRAAKNELGTRSTTITFRTYDNAGKEYTAVATITQEGSIVDTNIANFLAAKEDQTLYRITAIITKVVSADYGNVYIRDYSGETYVYGIGAQGDFKKAELKEGDIITLVGIRASYKDSPQMSKGELESFKHVTPISIVDFLELPDSDDDYYMLSGMVDEIVNPEYGNLYLSDGENSVYVYGCYSGWGATGDDRKNFLQTIELGVGDGLTVIGTKTTYKGVIELKNGIYFSHKK